MSACTFFGHRDCYDLDPERLRSALEALIEAGADTFYVGHQGQFDALVLSCLRRLRKNHRHITVSVVLAYLPEKTEEEGYDDCGIYPEGMETVHPRFAVDKRNRWMIARSDCCLCYINHTWGGAWKFVSLAKRWGLTIQNLGSGNI